MNKTLADHFACFVRNERWGTCGHCPRTPADDHPYPENCKNTHRYDHNYRLAHLVDLYSRTTKQLEPPE